MCPTFSVEIKRNGIRPVSKYTPFTEFDCDFEAIVKAKSAVIVTDIEIIRNYSDSQIPFSQKTFLALVSAEKAFTVRKVAGQLNILPERCFYDFINQDQNAAGPVINCRFNCNTGQFVDAIGRNKNTRLCSKKSSKHGTRMFGKCVHPRSYRCLSKNVVSLERNNYNSKTGVSGRNVFRIGKDESYNNQLISPKFGESYDQPSSRNTHDIGETQTEWSADPNLKYSVQASDDTEGAHSSHPLLSHRASELMVTNLSSVQETDHLNVTSQSLTQQSHGLPDTTRRPENQTQSSQPSGEPARYPEYSAIRRRMESFNFWPHPVEMQNRSVMAEWGLFFNGPHDLVRCYQCGIGLKDWSFTDDPMLEHIRYSPDCQHLVETIDPDLLQQCRSKVHQTSGPEEAVHVPQNGAASTTPSGENYRNPEYQNYNVRVASFSKWPRDIIQTPEQLAEAGFFYTGMQDVVRCFACDGGLQRWDPEDDPWIEHARWFQQCPYVLRVKGSEYVNLIQLALDEGSENEDEEGILSQGIGNIQIGNENGLPQPKKESEDPIYSPAAQSIIAFGYSRAAVKMAIEECNSKGIRWKADDLLNLLLDMEDRGETLPPDSPRPESPNGVPQIDRYVWTVLMK